MRAVLHTFTLIGTLIGGLVVLTASPASAQKPRSSVDMPATKGVPQFRDPKTGQIWTPLNVGQQSGPPTPEDLAGGPDSYRFADRGEMLSLLRGAGLRQTRVDEVATTVRCASADEFWEGLLAGSVRTSTTIQRQPERMRRRVRATLDRRLEVYAATGGLELPAGAVIGTGRR